MLFHATSVHTHTSCSAHNPANLAKFQQAIQAAPKIGVNVRAMYIDPPGHRIFMVFEADTVEQIVKFFDPIIELGDTDIRPVMDPMTAIDILGQQSD